MIAASAAGRMIGIVTVVACSALVAVHAQAPARGSGAFVIAPPIRVIEADTLEVQIDGQRIGVAVAGFIAPPGNTACGRAAIAAAESLVLDGVELYDDLALAEIDARLLRVYRVATADGASLAEQLALAGYGWPDPDEARALEYPSIVAAAIEARTHQRGCAWRVSAQP